MQTCKSCKSSSARCSSGSFQWQAPLCRVQQETDQVGHEYSINQSDLSTPPYSPVYLPPQQQATLKTTLDLLNCPKVVMEPGAVQRTDGDTRGAIMWWLFRHCQSEKHACAKLKTSWRRRPSSNHKDDLHCRKKRTTSKTSCPLSQCSPCALGVKPV